MIRVTIDAPEWYRRPALRWLARLFRLSRRWEASGRDALDLRFDLRRLSETQRFMVRFDRDHAWTITWFDDAYHVVETET